MKRKLIDFFDRIKYRLSKDCCYDEMEKRGSAHSKRCNGLMGGDRYTNYLSYGCVDCPYLDLKGIGERYEQT